jgi:hypothetical protein
MEMCSHLPEQACAIDRFSILDMQMKGMGYSSHHDNFFSFSDHANGYSDDVKIAMTSQIDFCNFDFTAYFVIAKM